MKKYFFVLGRYPAISVFEATQILNDMNFKGILEAVSSEVIVIESAEKLDLEEFAGRSGGTVKTGEVFYTLDFNDETSKLDEIFAFNNLLKVFFSSYKNKIHFGISLYDAGTEKNILSSLEDYSHKLTMDIKNTLKENGVRAGFLRFKDRSISSVSVEKNNLLDEGAEIVFAASGKKIYIGKTTTVQPFEQFVKRDMYRPYKDKRSGIMPVKLARIMVNLLGVPNGKTFLDPFCGGATIPIEAASLGYSKVYASDIKSDTVLQAKKNLDWFIRYSGCKTEVQTFISDARIISANLKEKVDSIATEPYLGPPLFQKPSPTSAQKISCDLKPLYSAFLQEAKKVLKTGGKISMVLPVFNTTEGDVYMDILDDAQKSGYRIQCPVATEESFVLKSLLSKRNIPIFGGNDQYVKREIAVFCT